MAKVTAVSQCMVGFLRVILFHFVHREKSIITIIIFLDESFAVQHNKRGILGMANNGRHTNGSQYYITLQPAPWMDKKYVAFG